MNINNIKTVKHLHTYLEERGWSTNSPHPDDEWTATAWPALTKNGRVSAKDLQVHSDLSRRGLVGPMTKDSEGNPCCEILESALK